MMEPTGQEVNADLPKIIVEVPFYKLPTHPPTCPAGQVIVSKAKVRGR
jgi:hypothetical protein